MARRQQSDAMVRSCSPSTTIETADQAREIRAALRPRLVRAADGSSIAVPCMNTLLVRRDLVVANGYNPNSVPEEKMNLLRQSIVDNGFCFPIVTIWDDEQGVFVIIDGFHRSLIGSGEWLGLEYLPVVVLEHDITKRMAATIQFNKARGVHQVDLDAEVIRKLLEQGLSEDDVAARLGIDLETVHRYKQLTGVAALFAKADYSMAWEMAEDDAAE